MTHTQFVKKSNSRIKILELCLAYEKMIKRSEHRLNDISHDIEHLNFSEIKYITKDTLLNKAMVTQCVINRLLKRQSELLNQL